MNQSWLQIVLWLHLDAGVDQFTLKCIRILFMLNSFSSSPPHRPLTLLYLLVLLHHLFTHCSGQSLHYWIHDVEISHIIDMCIFWRWGNRLQFIFIGILNTWYGKSKNNNYLADTRFCCFQIFDVYGIACFCSYQWQTARCRHSAGFRLVVWHHPETSRPWWGSRSWVTPHVSQTQAWNSSPR